HLMTTPSQTQATAKSLAIRDQPLPRPSLMRELRFNLTSVDLNTRKPAVRAREFPYTSSPNALAVGEGAVWALGLQIVSRFDLQTSELSSTGLLGREAGGAGGDNTVGGGGLALGRGSVWVAVSPDDAVWRLDPLTSSA